MANKRIGGLIEFKADGTKFFAKGNFTYDLGVPKKEMVVGSDSVHGFKETPKMAFIEGAITDTDELDTEALFRLRDVTVTVTLANGKMIVVEEAVYAGEGQGSTEEGEIGVRFEGFRGREIAAG